MTEFLRVYGYHGTSRTKAMSILNNGFRVSDNDYDWLGTGIYFFQDAPARAGAWAKEQYPEDPVVIRASIYLEGYMDLLDIVWFEDLKTIYSVFAEQYRFRGVPIPLQNPSISKAHRLDCAFFKYTTQLLLGQDNQVECIRAAFVEGNSIFPNSAIFDLAHVQIAVLNPALIKKCSLIEIIGGI
jgi:hypothetical protein